MIKDLIEAVYYYREDSAKGVPYWHDTTLIGIVVGVVCAAVAKYTGAVVDPNLQGAMIGVITGIGALLSPHTGIMAKPTAKIEEHNLTSLS
jgi:hypothetical protein